MSPAKLEALIWKPVRFAVNELPDVVNVADEPGTVLVNETFVKVWALPATAAPANKLKATILFINPIPLKTTRP